MVMMLTQTMVISILCEMIMKNDEHVNDNDVDSYGIMALIMKMEMVMINDQDSDCANGK